MHFVSNKKKPKNYFLLIWLFFSLILTNQICFSQAADKASTQFKVEELFKDQDVVWGFDFLDQNRIIYTLRSGKLKILEIDAKNSTLIKDGVPAVWAQGQGGLLDVRVHPKIKNRVYITYSEPLGDKSMTALGFGEIKENKLINFRKIFSGQVPNSEDIHFGSRIEFDGKGHIYFTIGDRNDRKRVQDLNFHNGKIIRLKEDGIPPLDNPFSDQLGPAKTIWSLGHRNPQGLAFRPGTSELWLSEMGPRGGDELNLIVKGRNYGWPIITYGREYWGPKIGEGSQKTGLEQPVAYWNPSISPSGMAFYSGDAFPQWKGNLFIGCLSGLHLRRVVLDQKNVVGQEELLKGKRYRIRNVRNGPDGFLYFSTDGGSISRIKPL